jgi:DNA-binding transcriptional LysR family regulator
MPLIIHENYTARLAESLKRGDLDVIVISLPFDEPGVVVQPGYDEPFRVLRADLAKRQYAQARAAQRSVQSRIDRR